MLVVKESNTCSLAALQSFDTSLRAFLRGLPTLWGAIDTLLQHIKFIDAVHVQRFTNGSVRCWSLLRLSMIFSRSVFDVRKVPSDAAPAALPGTSR